MASAGGDREWLDSFVVDFRRRFTRLLAFSFRSLDVVSHCTVQLKIEITLRDGTNQARAFVSEKLWNEKFLVENLLVKNFLIKNLLVMDCVDAGPAAAQGEEDREVAVRTQKSGCCRPRLAHQAAAAVQ